MLHTVNSALPIYQLAPEHRIYIKNQVKYRICVNHDNDNSYNIYDVQLGN